MAEEGGPAAERASQYGKASIVKQCLCSWLQGESLRPLGHPVPGLHGTRVGRNNIVTFNIVTFNLVTFES